MNIWDVMHGNIDKNLLRLHDAQAKAEERGGKRFPCPVCGGEVWWMRPFGNTYMLCCCKRCGMHFKGEL